MEFHHQDNLGERSSPQPRAEGRQAVNPRKTLAVALGLFLALACERPNLDETEGGYGRADTAADTAVTGGAVQTND
jgi:hypothetical protein